MPTLASFFDKTSLEMPPKHHMLDFINSPNIPRSYLCLFMHCVVRYVGRSVDQVVSTQYLLTFSRSIPDLWRGCPQWVNDPYWFSGHMLKGQGQTTILNPACCTHFTYFNPMVPCFGQVLLLQRRLTWIFGEIYVSETFLVFLWTQKWDVSLTFVYMLINKHRKWWLTLTFLRKCDN